MVAAGNSDTKNKGDDSMREIEKYIFVIATTCPHRFVSDKTWVILD